MGTLLVSTRETVVTQHGFIPLLLTWEEVGTYLLHFVMTEVSPEASKPSAAVRSASWLFHVPPCPCLLPKHFVVPLRLETRPQHPTGLVSPASSCGDGCGAQG